MSDIYEQINTLIQMQAVEVKILQIERSISAIGEAAAKLDHEIGDHETQVAEASRSLQALKKSYRDFDGDAKLVAEMIVKSNEKLRSVKTNKEYQSILKEIEELRKKKSGIEDQMLELLEQIESVEAAVAEKAASLEALTQTCQAKKAAMDDQAVQEREAIQALIDEKTKISANADQKTLSILKDVKKKVRGLAVVPVQQATCMGCHMNIPAQLFNELQRFDQLRFCPHCQRIIYWKEAEHE